MLQRCFVEVSGGILKRIPMAMLHAVTSEGTNTSLILADDGGMAFEHFRSTSSSNTVLRLKINTSASMSMSKYHAGTFEGLDTSFPLAEDNKMKNLGAHPW